MKFTSATVQRLFVRAVFDLSGGKFRGKGLTSHWLRTTPLLVTVKFGLGSDSTPRPQKGKKSKLIVKSL